MEQNLAILQPSELDAVALYDEAKLKTWIAANSLRIKYSYNQSKSSINKCNYTPDNDKVLAALYTMQNPPTPLTMNWSSLHKKDIVKEPQNIIVNILEIVDQKQSKDFYAYISSLTNPSLPPTLLTICRRHLGINLSRDAQTFVILSFALKYLDTSYSVNQPTFFLKSEIVVKLQDAGILPDESSTQMQNIRQVTGLLAALTQYYSLLPNQKLKQLSEKFLPLLIQLKEKAHPDPVEKAATDLLANFIYYQVQGLYPFALRDIVKIYKVLEKNPSSISQEVKEAHQRLRSFCHLISLTGKAPNNYVLAPANSQYDILVKKLVENPNLESVKAIDDPLLLTTMNQWGKITNSDYKHYTFHHELSFASYLFVSCMLLWPIFFPTFLFLFWPAASYKVFIASAIVLPLTAPLGYAFLQTEREEIARVQNPEGEYYRMTDKVRAQEQLNLLPSF